MTSDRPTMDEQRAARKRANYERAKRQLRQVRNERMAEVRRWYEAALANTRAAHGIDEDE